MLHVFGCKESNCNFIATTKLLVASHVRWHHRQTKLKRCSICDRELDNCNIKLHERSCSAKRKAEHPCSKCGSTTLNEMFCSRNCAASFNNSAKKIGYAKYREKNDIIGAVNYRQICAAHWPLACVICGWDLCIEVHHIDRDRKNNVPQNLIPLCLNHHKLTQLRKFRANIDAQIAELVTKKFHAPVTER